MLGRRQKHLAHVVQFPGRLGYGKWYSTASSSSRQVAVLYFPAVYSRRLVSFLEHRPQANAEPLLYRRSWDLISLPSEIAASCLLLV